MAGFATQERDQRIAQGKGTMADKIPFIISGVSCLCSCLVVVFMFATGRKNQAKMYASNFAGAMGTMMSSM